jgi:hypothetical protein
MANVIKVKGAQAALVANNSHATNISLATAVRVFNNHATAAGLVTVQTVSDSATVATGAVVKGSISIAAQTSEILRKDPSDEVWGSAVTVLAAPVSVEG